MLALAQPIEGPAPGCYERHFAKGMTLDNYSWMRVIVERQSENRSESEGSDGWKPSDRQITMNFGFNSLPDADFGYEKMTHCRQRGPDIECGAFCDGGRTYFRFLPGGDLLVESGGMRVSGGRTSSILLQPYSGLGFSGTYVLKRVSDAQCRTEPVASHGRTLLQVGDYHALVVDVTTQLAKLGFLTSPADATYTQEVANAMAAFQASVGLEPSGRADAQALRLLNVHAITGGGC